MFCAHIASHLHSLVEYWCVQHVKTCTIIFFPYIFVRSSFGNDLTPYYELFVYLTTYFALPTQKVLKLNLSVAKQHKQWTYFCTLANSELMLLHWFLNDLINYYISVAYGLICMDLIEALSINVSRTLAAWKVWNTLLKTCQTT